MPNPLTALLSGGIGTLIDSVGGIVDKLHTSDEEKLAAKLEMAKLANNITAQLIDATVELSKAQRDVVVAEAQGASKLQRNWRPLMMLLFGVIIANNFVVAPYLAAFGAVVPTLPIPPDMWDLLTVGIGGYIVGRSVEKGIEVYRGKAPEA